MSFYSIRHFIEQYYPEYYTWEKYLADECVTIHKTTDAWGVLSNFARTPLLVKGIQFKCAEQLFQLMKFKEPEAIKAVYAAGNPKMTAKHWERTCRRDYWGMMIVDAMKFVLQEKYNQCEDFRLALERSRGRFIVEDQTPFPKKTPDTWGTKLHNDVFEGPNLLGRLLMELRDKGSLTFQLPADTFGFVRSLP